MQINGTILGGTELSLILRDATVFSVTNSRYHANPSSDRVFFRRRCNDSTFPWRAVTHYWGEGGNKSRQQARVSKVRTDPIFPFIFPFPFSLRAPASINDACIYIYDELRLGVLSKKELSLILREQTVFRVTNFRYHVNPSSDRVFFRRRCNDSTFHLSRRSRARRRNESRRQARVSKVRTDPTSK